MHRIEWGARVERLNHGLNGSATYAISLVALALAAVALTGCQSSVSSGTRTPPPAVRCPDSATVVDVLTTAVIASAPESSADLCVGKSTYADKVWLSAGLKSVLATDGPNFPIMAVIANGGPESRCDAGPNTFLAVKVGNGWYRTRSYACGWTYVSQTPSK